MEHPAAIFFSSSHPLFSMLNAEFVEAQSQVLGMKFVAQKEFVEHCASNQLHSGYCTIILDSVMGGAVMGALGKLQPIATINLTTQHIERAVLDEVIYCRAEVQSIENQMAVVRGSVRGSDNKRILASAVGSFMIGTRATPLKNVGGRLA